MQVKNFFFTFFFDIFFLLVYKELRKTIFKSIFFSKNVFTFYLAVVAQLSGNLPD